MSARQHPLSCLYSAPLRLVALCVPSSRRRDWLAEWSAELWHILHAAAPQPVSPLLRHRAAAGFCRGALADALCLRSLAPRPSLRARSGSALACVAALALITLAAAGLAALLPEVRSTLTTMLWRSDSRTVSIWPGSLGDGPSPVLTLRTVREWQRRPQHLFSGFTFYQPVVKAVHLDAHHSPEMIVARAGADVFTVLGVPVAHQPSAAAGSALPRLVLTETSWRKRFASRTDVFGSTIRVGLQPAIVAGVVTDAAASKAAPIDAWLLLPQPLAAALPDNTRVFVLGRLAADAAPALHPQERWLMTVPALPDPARFLCVSIAADARAPVQIFVFTLFLALLSLPAITSVSLADYDRPPVSSTRPAVGRRRLFLALKIALLIPACFFTSVDLACAAPFHNPETAQYIQYTAGFALLLFSLQWALRDQRRRCPTCLSLLTCPARVGQPSRNFLAWNGTELICGGGHGLLHIPELPTSWFSRPRWLHLDPSWSSLFPRAA